MGAAANRRRLGELLVEEGFLSEQELAAALAEQQSSGRRLGEILVSRGILSGPALANMLADQYGGTVRTEYGIATGFRRRRAQGGNGDGDARVVPLPTGPAPQAPAPQAPTPQPAEPHSPAPPTPAREPAQPAPAPAAEAEAQRLEAELAEASRQAAEANRHAAEATRQAAEAAEASAARDRQLDAARTELERVKDELAAMLTHGSNDTGPSAAAQASEDFVAIAALGDRWATMLCRGELPPIGTEVEVREAPGVRFVVASHAWRRCVYLEPAGPNQPAP